MVSIILIHCVSFLHVAVTIGLDQAIYEFSEDDNEANLTVSILSGSLMRPVMVTLSLGNDTAIGESS